jgi:hypothetical protein
MARVELVTWQDLIEHLTDWMGGNPTSEARRDAKRASLSAVRDLANSHLWTYYYSKGRLVTSAPYSTGTVAYDHTGGAYERLLTLTDGTFPTWAAQGAVMIDDIVYEVYSYIDSTRLQLSTSSNPGADVDAGTSYTLFRDRYALPANFQAMGEMIIASFARTLQPEHPSSWLGRQRIWRGTATPHSYAIMGDPDYQNTLSMALYPPPDDAYSIDYMYKRRPRRLRIDSHDTGRVTVTSGSSAVTGVGTAFTSTMAGSVLRIGSTVNDVPTSRAGSYPFNQERIVTAVNSATSLTVDAAWDDSATLHKFMISDPVDVDTGAMLTALLRHAELETGHGRQKRDREELERTARQALLMAREADSRNFKEEAVGRASVWPTRLADFPFGGNG